METWDKQILFFWGVVPLRLPLLGGETLPNSYSLWIVWLNPFYLPPSASTPLLPILLVVRLHRISLLFGLATQSSFFFPLPLFFSFQIHFLLHQFGIKVKHDPLSSFCHSTKPWAPNFGINQWVLRIVGSMEEVDCHKPNVMISLSRWRRLTNA